MSTDVKRGEKFAKQVLGRLTGDNNEELASKISRKAVNAIQGQISALEADLIDKEITLEEANDSLNNAMYPVEMPEGNSAYVQQIVFAQSLVDNAQDDLDDVNDSIAYFKGLLDKF